MTDELRAKFEAWARDVGFKEFAKRADGEYATFISRTMFAALQFGHASRDAEVAKLQSIIDGQQDTIGALKRKLALAKESTK